MASLREIRRKIKSVKSTQQITKAMKMVAAARMRKSQAAILASRPFAVKMETALRELSALELAGGALESGCGPVQAYFGPKGDGGIERERNFGLILVTADKGLCGAFNTNVLRAAAKWIRAHQGEKMSIAVVGKKGREFLGRLSDLQSDSLAELTGIFPKASFAHAELVARPVLEKFKVGKLYSVTVIFNEFKSAVSQQVVEKELLPIPLPEGATSEQAGNPFGFGYEPGREELIKALVPRYITAQIFRVLLESQAAELAARMNAMDAATKNAGELIDALTLNMNRTRQAIITNELMEIVGGAEALAG